MSQMNKIVSETWKYLKALGSCVSSKQLLEALA